MSIVIDGGRVPNLLSRNNRTRSIGSDREFTRERAVRSDSFDQQHAGRGFGRYRSAIF